jgi:hypothetical protein
MKRFAAPALVALLLLAAFATVNAAFQKRVLEPTLGPHAAGVLAAAALAGAALLAALLWVGMRRN